MEQAYFESSDTEKKCGPFIKIWKVVVDKAVRWWCIRQPVEEPAFGSKEFLELQRKAVYYLRSCIKNECGLSVLQYAADRGLTKCVQTMLSTKDVFVTQTKVMEKVIVHEIDVTNLCPEYAVGKNILYSDMELSILGDKHVKDQKKMKGKQVGQNTDSFLDVLAKVKPANTAGEILESIPMIWLTEVEWRFSQWIPILWIILHMVVMTYATHEITASENNSAVWSPTFTVLGALIWVYASVIVLLHFIMKAVFKANMKESIQMSSRFHNTVKSNDIIFNLYKLMLRVAVDEIAFIIEFLFAAFAWIVFIAKMADFDMSDYVWIKGFFLLFGWLVLLIPLTFYGPPYKLISILKHIVVDDILPWILIWIFNITTSIGFATAIRLQFGQLPSSPTCVGDQPELAGFLHGNGHTFFELLIMTWGLDTDLKHVRSLTCLFEEHAKNVYVLLILISFYALISAVVFLNMLIAIMSNTVTLKMQDKGWRCYQVCQWFDIIHFIFLQCG